MDEKEFRSLFGMAVAEVEGADCFLGRQLPPATVYGDYCLDLDDWSKGRGEEMAKTEYATLASSESLEQDRLEKSIADFHASAFEHTPKLNDGCTDELRYEFLKNFMATADYQALHSQTRGNLLYSDMACLSILNSFAAQASKEQEKQEQAQANGENYNPKEQATERELDAVAAAKQAVQDVNDGREAMHTLGCGNSASAGNAIDRQRVASAFKQVKDNPMFRAIVNAAGNFRRLSQSLRKSRIIHGMDDVVGIRYSSSLEFMLPSETLYLSHERMRYEFARRLAEGEIRRFNCRGTKKTGKGPVIVYCDSSGSMGGSLATENIVQARGLSMAIAHLAKSHRRPYILCNFNHVIDPAAGIVFDNSPTEQLYKWLTTDCSGGTSFNFLHQISQEHLCQLRGCPVNKTDVILITDGLAPVNHPDAYVQWKKSLGVKLITILIGVSSGYDDLRAISDSFHTVSELGINSPGVEECLTI